MHYESLKLQTFKNALCNLPINGLWFNNSKFDMKKIVGGDST
jgi:hypothetical protein